jgi:hypothetical protein
MFDRVRVLGEQRNHKVERVDLSPHALNISLFLLRTWSRSFMGTSSTSPYFRLRFSPKNSSSGVEQALDRLRPLLRFRFSSHELGRPSQRQVGRRSDEKGYAIPRARVVDIEVEIESLPREMSASIQQYQVVDMGSPQRSPRLEVVSRVDCNAVTLQHASAHLASAMVGVDEENFLVIENRAAKWWWLVHANLPKLERVPRRLERILSPGGVQVKENGKAPIQSGSLGLSMCLGYARLPRYGEVMPRPTLLRG